LFKLSNSAHPPLSLSLSLIPSLDSVCLLSNFEYRYAGSGS
jgi:hypothetical protein